MSTKKGWIMSTLYDIDQRLTQLEEWGCDPETGELLSEEEFAKKFDEIAMELDKKIENTLLFSKELDAEAKSIKEEESKLSTRRKQKENLSTRLTDNIDRYIRHLCSDEEGNLDAEKLNKYKFDTPRVSMGYRKSSKVVVTDATKIPSEFIKTKVETDVDKAGLKKYLSDHTIEGATVEKFYNMTIK